MKRNKTKKIDLLLACMLMISVCTACGSKTSEEDGTTLTWYMPGKKPADCDLVEEKINEIIEPKIGAKLDFVYLDSGAYDEKLNMLMASKTEFDLCFSGWINKYSRGVSAKGFLKLNDYLEKAPALVEGHLKYLATLKNWNANDLLRPDKKLETNVKNEADREQRRREVQEVDFDFSK